ncbi:MAG: EF-hand domain-containing protein [Lacipirellulaceae bacterium]
MELPDLDPADAAQQAVELYDKDDNQSLSKEELASCPGLLMSLKAYDLDSDESISEEEIKSRLKKLVEKAAALSRVTVTLKLNKKPLPGATIRFVPEPYLGEAIKSATGKTLKRGVASMAVADEELPDSQKGIRGIHPGTYRVEITHPEVEIPAKYNTNTTLGYETTPGNPYASFDLKSK